MIETIRVLLGKSFVDFVDNNTLLNFSDSILVSLFCNLFLFCFFVFCFLGVFFVFFFLFFFLGGGRSCTYVMNVMHFGIDKVLNKERIRFCIYSHQCSI